MEKKEEYKYYSTQRPVDIGTYPKSRENPMIGFTNYDSRIPVESGAFRAWGELTYAKPLMEKEAADYELRPCPENPDLVARRAARVQKLVRHPPIAEQLKTAEKLTGENRAQPAPKKDAPDHGDR